MDKMNSRERVLAAMRRQPVDRLPLDIWATPEVNERLLAHFGNRESMRDGLHLDSGEGVGAEYIGPALPTMPDGQTIDFWGIQTKKMGYGSGSYAEQCHWPLAYAKSIDDLKQYRWPTTDWFDYSKMRDKAKLAREQRHIACGYMAPFYFHNLLRGLEQSLMDPLEDPEFAHYVIERISRFFLEHHRRMFEACEGLIDVCQVTDDLGTQTGPMIGMETYRAFYRPHHKRMADLCREFGILVFHHDDGAIRPFLPDLIDFVGINVLNPIQWRCPGMDPACLKRDFGAKVCFHGGVDNQQTLPRGTTDEVRAEVRMLMDTLGSDGTGYIVGPCHAIQSVTPIENILAMYDEAYRYGRAR